MEDPKQEPRMGRRRRLFNRGRNYFLTGIIVAAPLAITIFLTAWIVNFVDGWVKPLIPGRYNPENYLPFPLPGIGIVVAVAALTLLGFVTANIFGRTILRVGESILDRLPLVRNLYKALKQIFETILSERSHTFRRAGLVEYPRRGTWAVVFIATDAKGEVSEKIPEEDELISVFLPTTPNPTSGFLLFVPARDVLELEMSVEEAAKLVISAGLITPDWPPAGRGAFVPRSQRGSTPLPVRGPVSG